MGSRLWPLAFAAAGLVLGIAFGGCSAGDAFACSTDEACGDGTCESGYCAFPDEGCESGKRFGAHAGGGQADQCVPPSTGTSEASSGPGTGMDSADATSTTADPSTTAGTTTTGDPSTTAVDGTTSGPTSGGVLSTGDETSDGSSTGAPLERVEEGLIAYYRPDQINSGDTVPDISGVDPALDMTLMGDGLSWAGGGLQTDGDGIVLAEGSPSKIRDACQLNDGLTVEAWVTPGLLGQTGPARLVTFSPTGSARNFTLGQGDSTGMTGWSGRIRTTDTDNNGMPTLLSTNAKAGGLTHLVMTRAADGTFQLHENGQLIAEDTRLGDLSNWSSDPTYVFAWGNEPTLDRDWIGIFFLVAVYDRALTTVEIAQNYDVGLSTGAP